MACTYRQLDLVQRLLRHPSVIVDVRDVEGNTPLHCSLGANRGARAPSGAADLALIRTLCASGAECTLQNAAGHSVRSLAVRGVSASVPADEAAWPAAVASAWDKVRLACLGGVAMRRTQHEQLMALLLRQESAAVCSSTLPASESAPLAAALVSTAASAPVDAAACALPQPLPEALIALIVDFTLGTAPPSHEALAAALDALSSNPS